MKKIFKKLYFEKIENWLGRALYLHNTINSHFIIMSILGVIFYHLLIKPVIVLPSFLIYSVLVALIFYFFFKLADFYLWYLAFGPVIFYFFFKAAGFFWLPAVYLTIINILLFFISQFIFFGFAYILILKDFTTPFRIALNSVFCLAPTTASFLVSLFFTSLFSLTLVYQPNPFSNFNALAFFASLLVATVITRVFLPKNRNINYPSVKARLKSKAKRVIILNIDGCSLKKFLQAKIPNIEKLKNKGFSFEKGALTVYRGLTNPAFASILTGTTPEIHGVNDNNIGSGIKTKALPDIVPTIIYGCIHMQQFAKKNWHVRVVSLPQYGFKADEVVIQWLKKDIAKSDKTRLFVVDLSSVDMAGHAYGSYSQQYLDQIQRADNLIGEFLNWLEKKDYFKDSLVIIGSDHGMKLIDHAYLLFSEEKEIPLIFLGKGVKCGQELTSQPSIMDIAPTISYTLGIDYPEGLRAKVLEEIFE